MRHSRLDKNKTPTLQSSALQNKLFGAYNLTHDQANWAARQSSGELGSRYIGQQAKRRLGRQPARQLASPSASHAAKKLACYHMGCLPGCPAGKVGKWSAKQATHLSARARSRVALLPAASHQWLWRNACIPVKSVNSILISDCSRRICLTTPISDKKYIYLIYWITDSYNEGLVVYRKIQTQFRIKCTKCDLPASWLHTIHCSNFHFKDVLLLYICSTMSCSEACHLLLLNSTWDQRTRYLSA